jgi:hypothetical protein
VCEPVVTIGECDPWCQDCPTDHKCMPIPSTSEWTTVCVPLAQRPLATGEPCQLPDPRLGIVDDCGRGDYCWGWSETCAPLCEGTVASPECEDPGDRCTIYHSDAILAVCLPPCDPSEQCGDSWDTAACYAWPNFGPQFPMSARGTFTCLYVWQFAPAVGEQCWDFPNCEPGLFCAPPETVPACDAAAYGCCTPHCNLGEPDACAEAVPGTQCRAVFAEGAAPVGLEHIGACVLP